MNNKKNSNYVITAVFSSSLDEPTNIKTNCQYNYNPEFIEIFYQESTNQEFVTTNIKIYNSKKVEIIRTQNLSSNIITVEKNKRISSDYNTPYGKFIIGITGTETQIKLGAEGGSFLLSYEIDFDNQKSHTNTVCAQIFKNNESI